MVLLTSLKTNQNAVARLEEKIGVLEFSYKDKVTALEARVASLEEKNQSLLTDHTSSIATLQANVDAYEQYATEYVHHVWAQFVCGCKQ